MLNRAYSLIEVKESDSERRTFGGIATSPVPDRVGDIIEPKGVTFARALPLLLYHDSQKPVGEARFGKPTATGIPFDAQISTINRPGVVKERLDEAVDSLNAKPPLIRGVSIGFRPLVPPVFIKETGGYRYPSVEVMELSMVVIPTHQQATIQVLKSLDQPYLAASGTRQAVPSLPGVTGQPPKASAMNVSEQLSAEREALQIKSVRLEELMASEGNEGGLEAGEQAELDTLTKEVPVITSRINRLSTLEAAQAAQAASVTTFAPPAGQKSNNGRTGRVEVVNHAKELPQGTLFARYAMAVAAGKGSMSDTLAYAKRWDAQTPEVSRYIKAEAGSSVLASPGWGSQLVTENTPNLSSEFVDLIRPQTIIGKVEGFRKVPFNVRIPVQSGGSTVNWVGEAAPKPVTELEFTTTTVPYHKIAGIIVLTEELVRFSSPDAEATVRRDLTEQIAQFMDEQFIRIAVTAGANNPASITNGVTAPNASGTTLAALFADLKTALASFDTAGITTDGLVIVTTPAVARILSFMTNQLGLTPNGFGVSPQGGTLLGYPVIVSASVDAGTLVFFKPSEVFLADDGRVTLDASNQATLDMAGGSTPDFNLWQKNCIGIRAERFVTWVKRRAGVVAVIDTIAYVPGT